MGRHLLHVVTQGPRLMRSLHFMTIPPCSLEFTRAKENMGITAAALRCTNPETTQVGSAYRLLARTRVEAPRGLRTAGDAERACGYPETVQGSATVMPPVTQPLSSRAKRLSHSTWLCPQTLYAYFGRSCYEFLRNHSGTPRPYLSMPSLLLEFSTSS